MNATRHGAHPIASTLVAAALLLYASAASGFDQNPVIFVHGGFGSGGQFESQAMRFSSNGYPDSHLAVLEYDSTFGVETFEEVLAKLDALIADVKASTGAAQVDLMGHSLGTRVSQEFLSSPARAANVAHYVNIDGGEADAPPGDVPTLAIWAGTGTPGRRILGATNVTVPNQTHVESATSRESFAAMYEFLTGKHPMTRDIRVDRGRIEISGRALLFPQNVFREGVTLEIWEVHPLTGRRKGIRPRARYALPADGSFGPFRGIQGKNYEFVLLREGAREHRLYFEPFLRSDHFVRLLTSEPGQGVDTFIERSDRHVHMTIVRYKEFWGDQGADDDILEINEKNVLNAAITPQSKRAIGLFVFDAGSDGVSDLMTPIPTLFGLPFLSGVDLHVPADPDSRGVVSIELTPRGDARAARVVNVPNHPSTLASITVQLNDFEDPRAERSGRFLRVPRQR